MKFIKLFIKTNVWKASSWLERLENLQHELFVAKVIPCISGVQITIQFWDHEDISTIHEQERSEKELHVYVIDEVFWHLNNNIVKPFIIECVIFIATPLVIKEAFDLFLEFQFDGFVVIELF